MTEHMTMIEDCEIRESKLSSWEVGFIANVRDRLEARKSLSTTQIEILNDIWEKVTEDG